VQRLQNELQQATYRIGYLEAQLQQRLLPDHELNLRNELAQAKAERDLLQQSLSRAAAPWRTWLLIGLVIIVAVLATILATVFVLGAR